MFYIATNEVNENLKAHVSSNSIYQHKTNNNWAGAQWDIDAHVGTQGLENVKVIVSQSIA